MVAEAKKQGMKALAITDHGCMFGVIEFYQECLRAGIKPIVGMEVYLAPGSRLDKTTNKGPYEGAYHLTLLAKNMAGYRNLMKLSSIGYLEGFYYKPRIDKEVLTRCHEGLICLSGCLKGELAQALKAGKGKKARGIVEEFQGIFGEDYYIEVMNHGLDEEVMVGERLADMAAGMDLERVATNDVHYLKHEHAQAHDILLCIQTGKDREDPKRLRFNTDQIYFKSPQEMAQAFQGSEDVLANTLKVAENCNLVLDFGERHFPHYLLPEVETARDLNEYLGKLARSGLERRYGSPSLGMRDRLEYELGVIGRMGFAGYFLIVKDFIDYARSQDIPVGPGRGSAAGSLVSYCLGITNIDPIKFDLLFERFLNPERLSLPDIDIDFSDAGRDRVIDYVRQKYGTGNVAQIITFGKMLARGVIRDVGRVLKIPYGEVDRLAKLIPFGPQVSLTRVLKEVKEFREAIEDNEIYQQLIEHALVLEGLNRNASTHAAGVVMAPSELINFVPLFKPSKGEEITTQYDMDALDEIGLLKMDFLGLRTLTVIDETLKMLHHRGVDLEIDKIPMDDTRTFQLFSNGETVGIFQFESSGMRDCLRKLQPERLGDLIALNALYRPGPMIHIDEFIQRKHETKDIKYPHPLLEPILKETYGIIVYQEQVMRIASDFAGFSLARGDILRKAMGKKQTRVMKSLEAEFIAGAAAKDIDEETARKVFDLISRFAEYGFNKSHSAAYALLAYQTAYLKAHYPVEFMAASLSSEMDSSDRIMVLLDECRRMDIVVQPPDVNQGFYKFTVVDGKIGFGLGAIKNVGQGAIESIIQAREQKGSFHTLFDVVEGVDTRLVNKKVLESLIKAGAMDSLEGHRAQLLAGVEMATAYAQGFQEDRELGQTSIFDQGHEAGGTFGRHQPHLPGVDPWTKTESLSREKELLGYYISGHPLNKFRDEVEAFSSFKFDDTDSVKDGRLVRVGGIITRVKTHQARNGRMAFATLEDFTGTIELLIFSDTYQKFRRLVRADSMVMVIGRASTKENESIKVIAERIIPLTEARSRLAKRVCLSLSTQGLGGETLNEIDRILGQHGGKCAVVMKLKTESGEELFIRSDKYRVDPSHGLIDELKDILGRENVWIEG